MNCVLINKAPISSNIIVYLNILLNKSIIWLKLFKFNDSFNNILSDKLIFLPIIVNKRTKNAINPKPPICIKHIITN